MKYVLATLILMIVWFHSSLTGHAEDEIGEEYIVKMLDGDLRKSAVAAPFGFAFSLPLPRVPEGTVPTGRQTTKKDKDKDKGEEFYRRLIPVGRTLESEAVRGLRFAVSVSTQARVHGNQDGHVSLAVAGEIKQFLITHFAITAERLVVREAEATLPQTDIGAESTSTPRWRVEIIRLE